MTLDTPQWQKSIKHIKMMSQAQRTMFKQLLETEITRGKGQW